MIDSSSIALGLSQGRTYAREGLEKAWRLRTSQQPGSWDSDRRDRDRNTFQRHTLSGLLSPISP